jgi:tetratricopeptide (TPR) repeat protein
MRRLSVGRRLVYGRRSDFLFLPGGRRVSLSFIAAALLLAPMPGAAEAERFKNLFERAEAHFRAGDYGAAVALFRQADRLRVTPEVAYDLAKCFEKLGDEAYTVYYYRLYLRRAPDAPDTLEVAEKVGTALAKAESEGQGFLELDAPRATAVRLEGRQFPEPPVALFLAPGDYEVSAEFPGGTRTMTVHIVTGRTTTVSFEPLAPPLVPLEDALPPELLARGALAPAGPGPSKLRIASYATAGVGVAMLVAGLVLGLASSGDAARLESDRALTVSEAQGLADAASGKAVAANVLFGAGGAAVAGGAILFVLSMPEPGTPSGGAR